MRSARPFVLAAVVASTNGRALRMCSPFYTGVETAAVMEFDFQLVNSAAGFHFALAGNGEPSTSIDGNSPIKFGPQVVVQGGNNQATFSLLTKTALGVYATAITTPVTSLVNGHWYRVTFQMNFGANTYDGSGSLSYKDLTTGGAATPVSAIQNINLHLTCNSPNFVNIPGNWQRYNVVTNNYSKSPNFVNLQDADKGSVQAPILYQGPIVYPPAAQAIGDAAGLLPAYSDIDF